jgi:hypothetical protein
VPYFVFSKKAARIGWEKLGSPSMTARGRLLIVVPDTVGAAACQCLSDGGWVQVSSSVASLGARPVQRLKALEKLDVSENPTR